VAASSQYASAGNPAELQITGDLTLECRVKFTSLPSSGSMALIGKVDNTADKFCYRLWAYHSAGTGHRIYMAADTGNGDDANRTRAYVAWSPVVDTWYTIRGSIDLSTSVTKIFLDGSDTSATADNQNPGTVAINNEDAPLTIGAWMDGGSPVNFLDGVIDAVVVAATYTATASEPLNVTPSTTYISNMAGLWNFNGSSYADGMPAGNDLTGVNSPTFVDGYPFQL